jgi:hypothetical protein
MSIFPLYETLFSSMGDIVELKREERQKIVKSIAKLNQDGHHKLYALLMYHCFKNKLEPFWDTTTQATSASIQLDFNNLSPILQSIIRDFCELHLKHMKEHKAHKSRSK